jgi:hypothetical protein
MNRNASKNYFELQLNSHICLIYKFLSFVKKKISVILQVGKWVLPSGSIAPKRNRGMTPHFPISLYPFYKNWEKFPLARAKICLQETPPFRHERPQKTWGTLSLFRGIGEPHECDLTELTSNKSAFGDAVQHLIGYLRYSMTLRAIGPVNRTKKTRKR